VAGKVFREKTEKSDLMVDADASPLRISFQIFTTARGLLVEEPRRLWAVGDFQTWESDCKQSGCCGW